MRRVIIDTDPGIDDALALTFALKTEAIEIAGITTVAGNVPVELATANALRVLQSVGAPDIPVASGASRPLSRRLVTSEHIHGGDGLGNLHLPPADLTPHRLTALEFMRQTIHTSREDISIVALGPLTNLAMLVIADPKAFARVKEVVIMGGAAKCPGNITPRAEFNMYVDPDAARLVLESGVPIKMVGLDVTMQVILYRQHLAELAGNGSPAAKFAHKLASRALNIIPEREEAGGCALHDPLAVAVLAYPQLVSTERRYVQVGTENGVGRGETAVDFRAASDLQPNVDVALDVDAEQFMKVFLTTLTK